MMPNRPQPWPDPPPDLTEACGDHNCRNCGGPPLANRNDCPWCGTSLSERTKFTLNPEAYRYAPFVSGSLRARVITEHANEQAAAALLRTPTPGQKITL